MKFDLEFDLKFEVSDARNQVKLLGRTFLPARPGKHENFGANFGAISEKVLREAKPGGFQTRGFPTFFGKGPDCVADPFGTVPRRRS